MKKTRKPTLTAEEKAERARQRMIEKAYEKSTGTYSAECVAPVFQQMIRAEAAAQATSVTAAIVNGGLEHVLRMVGQCVCVTCGKVSPWTTQEGTMQTGHFVPGRTFSVLYREDNVAPQCSYCNNYLHGATDRFRLWMSAVRGDETIERLERLKATTRQYTREDLVDMKIGYKVRLEAAKERML
jgi:hypothetical protein